MFRNSFGVYVDGRFTQGTKPSWKTSLDGKFPKQIIGRRVNAEFTECFNYIGIILLIIIVNRRDHYNGLIFTSIYIKTRLTAQSQ